MNSKVTKPKVFIAIPCLDMMDVDFVRSLTYLKTKADVSVNFLSGSLVYAARETLADEAIKSGADYVLWLDSDMVFPPSLLDDMLKADKDFVTGLCFRRKPPYTPCIYKTIKPGLTVKDTVIEEYLDYPEDSLFPIDACGFAAVLVKTEVLKAVKDFANVTFMPLPGYGEDISFCLRARKLGYELYCDSRVKLGHIGKSIVDEPTYKRIKENGGYNDSNKG